MTFHHYSAHYVKPSGNIKRGTIVTLMHPGATHVLPPPTGGLPQSLVLLFPRYLL